jgi:hypothetical protein
MKADEVYALLVPGRMALPIILCCVLPTGFHLVWDRKYQKYFYPVQIQQSRKFKSIPTYKMHSAGAIFKFWRRMAHQQQKVLYHV